MIDSEGTDDTFLCSTNDAFHTEMMAVAPNSASVCHPSPKVRARTVGPEAGKEAISGGSAPVKALVRGVPLPRPPSLRVRLGCLPLAVLGPVSGEAANEVVS